MAQRCVLVGPSVSRHADPSGAVFADGRLIQPAPLRCQRRRRCGRPNQRAGRRHQTGLRHSRSRAERQHLPRPVLRAASHRRAAAITKRTLDASCQVAATGRLLPCEANSTSRPIGAVRSRGDRSFAGGRRDPVIHRLRRRPEGPRLPQRQLSTRHGEGSRWVHSERSDGKPVRRWTGIRRRSRPAATRVSSLDAAALGRLNPVVRNRSRRHWSCRRLKPHRGVESVPPRAPTASASPGFARGPVGRLSG
jgi:hypothetical protein